MCDHGRYLYCHVMLFPGELRDDSNNACEGTRYIEITQTT